MPGMASETQVPASWQRVDSHEGWSGKASGGGDMGQRHCPGGVSQEAAGQGKAGGGSAWGVHRAAGERGRSGTGGRRGLEDSPEYNLISGQFLEPLHVGPSVAPSLVPSAQPPKGCGWRAAGPPGWKRSISFPASAMEKVLSRPFLFMLGLAAPTSWVVSSPHPCGRGKGRGERPSPGISTGPSA